MIKMAGMTADRPVHDGGGRNDHQGADLCVCLAGSGGGHVRQLLDLQPIWQGYDYFFVTEGTALGRSLSSEHPTHFVEHVALGQAKLGAPITMVWKGILNFIASARLISKRRPDVVITTGAGSMFFTILFARAFGAQVILIDSFARFKAPSIFARIAGRFAHVRIAQSEASAAKWKGALTFDPFRILDDTPPAKEPLLFATVGATLPFDRLVRLVADAKARGFVPEEILIQTGEGGMQPEGLRTVESLSFGEMKEALHRADIVVCHGGTGSLITALRAGCRIIAVPRRFPLGEHYDDHQLEITSAFAARGLLDVLTNDEEFPALLERARARTPKCATTDPAELQAFLRQKLGEYSRLKRSRRKQRRFSSKPLVSPKD